MAENKQGNWFKRHKILTGIIAFIVVVSLISAATDSGKQNKPTAKTTTKAVTTTAENKVSQGAAEKYCQDANLLQKYIDIKNTSVVTLSYNPQYNDSGSHAPNGDKIYSLQWDGKNKKTGAKILFVCDVSGTDKKITLHNLAVDGNSVYGPVDEN